MEDQGKALLQKNTWNPRTPVKAERGTKFDQKHNRLNLSTLHDRAAKRTDKIGKNWLFSFHGQGTGNFRIDYLTELQPWLHTIAGTPCRATRVALHVSQLISWIL